MNQLLKNTRFPADSGGGLCTSFPRLEAKKTACRVAGIRDFGPAALEVGFVMVGEGLKEWVGDVEFFGMAGPPSCGESRL
jgi:hypothetical protein